MKLLLSLFLSLLISSANAGFSEALDALKTGDFKTAIFNLEKEIEKSEDDTFTPMLYAVLANSYYQAQDDIDNDYKLAFKNYLIASKRFDANVQYKLGVMYDTGQGVEQDFTKAIEHFEQSIKYKEKPYSLWRLGKIYLLGKGVTKDYDKAKEYFERAEAVGDANSQFELGHIHEYGKGIPISLPRAIHYYEKSAEQGDADAQYKLDLLTGKVDKKDWHADFETALDFTYGYTVDVDFDKAIEYYQKAADKGSAVSLYNIGFIVNLTSKTKQSKLEFEYYKKSAELGNIYAQTVLSNYYAIGIGVNVDDEKSFYWDMQAALNGNLSSIKSVADGYYSGVGTSKNYDEAINWYQKAIDMGDDESVYDIAAMYEDGEGFEEDTDKAIELYTQAADMGYAKAQNTLSEYYLKGIHVKRDYQKSYDLALKAAEQGFSGAQNKLGFFYQTGKNVVEVDMEKALSYYEKAAEQGSVKAQYNLGILYLNGIGIKKDKSKAFALFKKSADLGHPDAQHQVGAFYDFAIGDVQKDVKEAIKWYKKAAAKDFKKSEMSLGGVYYYGDKDANIQKNYKKAADYYYTAAKNKTDDSAKNKVTLKRTSSGSGFFVTPNHIITNNHVTAGCDKLEVKNKGYKSSAKLLDTDSTTDLSILVTGKPNNNFLYLRNRKPVVTGEQSLVLGYPFSSTLGSELKVTSGNIAALTGFKNNIAELQLTSPVQPGNSGGPLLDDNGNVIGVIVSRLEKSSAITGSRVAQNVNFAIKSNMAKIFMDLNMVDYQVRKSNGVKEISQIVTEAKEATVQVICKEKE